IRTIIKEEVTTQLPQIPPQAVYDFATPVIEKNVAELLEAAVLKRSSSQLQSTYEASAALSKFKLTKMLIDKTEKNKSYDKAAYKWELYEAPVKSYETDKDLFDLYGEVFTLKRSRDDRDKDRDPSTRSDRGTKQRKSSKGLSHLEIQEEPSHTVKDSGVQKDQDFITKDNNEQPVDKETWISQVSRAKEPHTSFDELMDTSFDFTAFVLNQLNIKDLTQEILQTSLVDSRSSRPSSYLSGFLHQQRPGISKRFAANMSSSKDVYSRKRIIAVTRIAIMKKSNLRNRTTYTAYSDPKGVIYKDENNRNRLMCADELLKFSDGTLNDVRTALYDIAKGIRMEYLPKRK
ncbi:hypothetical protein Tco_1454124, partial [Tanacetum coccineum]